MKYKNQFAFKIDFYQSNEDYKANLMKISPDKLLYQDDLNDNYVIISGI